MIKKCPQTAFQTLFWRHSVLESFHICIQTFHRAPSTARQFIDSTFIQCFVNIDLVLLKWVKNWKIHLWMWFFFFNLNVASCIDVIRCMQPIKLKSLLCFRGKNHNIIICVILKNYLHQSFLMSKKQRHIRRHGGHHTHGHYELFPIKHEGRKGILFPSLMTILGTQQISHWFLGWTD